MAAGPESVLIRGNKAQLLRERIGKIHHTSEASPVQWGRLQA